MSGPTNISKIERLRARDGSKCWFCDQPINFKADPLADRAPSTEHLIPQCRDGSDKMENLVLCHRSCNQLLDNLPLVEKIKLRDAAQKRKWLTAMRKKIVPLLNP